MALATSQEYQDAADAPSTLRSYAEDLTNFRAWLLGPYVSPIKRLEVPPALWGSLPSIAYL